MILEFLADDQIEIKIWHAAETPIIVGGSAKIVDEASYSLQIHLPSLLLSWKESSDLIRQQGTSPPVRDAPKHILKVPFVGR